MGCRSLEADQQVPYPQARAPGRGDRGSSSDCSYSHERPPFVTRTASRQPLRVAPVVLCRATYLLEYDRPGLDDTPHGGSTGPVELSMTGSRFGGVNGPKRHLLRVECSAASVFSEIGMLVQPRGLRHVFHGKLLWRALFSGWRGGVGGVLAM